MAKSKKRRPLVYNASAEIIRAEHLPIVTGMSTVTIWRRRRAGQFVPAIHLGKNSIGFRRVDIEAWLAARTEPS